MDVVAPYDKLNKLKDYMRTKPPGHKTIVFCGTKRMCDQVTDSMREHRAMVRLPLPVVSQD